MDSKLPFSYKDKEGEKNQYNERPLQSLAVAENGLQGNLPILKWGMKRKHVWLKAVLIIFYLITDY